MEWDETAQACLTNSIQGIMAILTSITADCTNSKQSEENESLSCFCLFLLNCLRGCYIPCFSIFITQIVIFISYLLLDEYTTCLFPELLSVLVTSEDDYDIDKVLCKRFPF